MESQPEEDDVFDIGVGAESAANSANRGIGAGGRRRLPTWMSAGIALLIGWMLGAFLNASPAAPTEQAVPGEAEPVEQPEPLITPEPSATAVADTAGEEAADAAAQVIEGPVEAVYENPPPAPPAVADVTTVVMVRAPLRGVAIPAEITVIDDGISTLIELDELIGGATQGSLVGRGDQRMLVVGDSVVFMASKKLMLLNPETKDTPVELGEAIYLLRGSDEGHVWAIGSGSRTATDISVDQPGLRQIYSLADVGSPLGSLNGGLVVAPKDQALGDFALWNPRTGVQSLSLHDGAEFIDAAGNEIVMSTPDGLATYNVVTGVLRQTDFQMERRQTHRSIVSPDGARLAIVERGLITELPNVKVVDTRTGEIIDEFKTAFEWQLQWVSPDEVLFLSPLVDSVRVNLRDTSTSSTTTVTDLVGPNFWVAVSS